ncbi:hypothetical protein OAT00_01430 [Pelagibacteraceae bacterium]|nr:hypothetical protein [Pelagibacteraceae bacterium]
MKFREFKNTLNYKNYNLINMYAKYLEYKIKQLLYRIFLGFNFKKKGDAYIFFQNYEDNRFINFIFHSLKKDFIFLYSKKNQQTISFIKKIGLLNFFKYSFDIKKLKDKKKILYIGINNNEEKIVINTNYYGIIKKKQTDNYLIMPYYVYPKIYNSYYSKIKYTEKPKFKIFFSGSIYSKVYSNFIWDHENYDSKFLNRVRIINEIIKEFKNQIFFITNKNDLKNSKIFNKKIIFCLHDKMVSKNNYILDFKKNFLLMSQSAFNLNCPGAVMPLCHHFIEGIKVGSIPITPYRDFIFPKLDKNLTLEYYDKASLLESFYNALKMNDDDIMNKREKLKIFYNENLSPESFKIKFLKNLNSSNKKNILVCNDHESVERLKNNL